MKFCRHFYTDTLKENLQIFSFLECTYTVKKNLVDSHLNYCRLNYGTFELLFV